MAEINNPKINTYNLQNCPPVIFYYFPVHKLNWQGFTSRETYLRDELSQLLYCAFCYSFNKRETTIMEIALSWAEKSFLMKLKKNLEQGLFVQTVLGYSYWYSVLRFHFTQIQFVYMDYWSENEPILECPSIYWGSILGNPIPCSHSNKYHGFPGILLPSTSSEPGRSSTHLHNGCFYKKNTHTKTKHTHTHHTHRREQSLVSFCECKIFHWMLASR